MNTVAEQGETAGEVRSKVLCDREHRVEGLMGLVIAASIEPDILCSAARPAISPPPLITGCVPLLASGQDHNQYLRVLLLLLPVCMTMSGGSG